MSKSQLERLLTVSVEECDVIEDDGAECSFDPVEHQQHTNDLIEAADALGEISDSMDSIAELELSSTADIAPEERLAIEKGIAIESQILGTSISLENGAVKAFFVAVILAIAKAITKVLNFLHSLMKFFAPNRYKWIASADSKHISNIHLKGIQLPYVSVLFSPKTPTTIKASDAIFQVEAACKAIHSALWALTGETIDYVGVEAVGKTEAFIKLTGYSRAGLQLSANSSGINITGLEAVHLIESVHRLTPQIETVIKAFDKAEKAFQKARAEKTYDHNTQHVRKLSYYFGIVSTATWRVGRLITEDTPKLNAALRKAYKEEKDLGK